MPVTLERQLHSLITGMQGRLRCVLFLGDEEAPWPHAGRPSAFAAPARALRTREGRTAGGGDAFLALSLSSCLKGTALL